MPVDFACISVESRVAKNVFAGTRQLSKAAGLKYRSQVTGYRSQVTDHRSQVTDHRSQVTGYRPQVTGRSQSQRLIAINNTVCVHIRRVYMIRSHGRKRYTMPFH